MTQCVIYSPAHMPLAFDLNEILNEILNELSQRNSRGPSKLTLSTAATATQARPNSSAKVTARQQPVNQRQCIQNPYFYCKRSC